MKKGFTLIELLVVIAVIAMLTALLLPSLRRAKLQAKILTVNAELRQVSLALGLYHDDYKEYPPTMVDCGSGQLQDHIAQLPELLADYEYLPATSSRNAMDTIMEDPFNPGHTYKYSSCGEVILDRNIIDKDFKAPIWVPNGFPGSSSLTESEGVWYDNIKTSPVQWVIYSLGPDFDQDEFLASCDSKLYPVPKELWYNPEQKKGLIVRVRLKNGREIGSFEGYK